MRSNNPHAWYLSDLERVPPNGLTVMSTFACGGGSSMGYKRAGYRVVAANDIDPEMAWHYKRNIKPKHYFLCPIRDLLTADLPAELFNLDILDGSPPCSTFSMAGSREDAWGKDKHFREGQAKQVLSDLFFDFLDVAERLKPRVILAENVKGMLAGNAKGYCKLIFSRLREIGYRPQLFLLNAADCGVPQRRERVFFCAVRADISTLRLALLPSCQWVAASDACADLKHLTAAERHDTAPTPLDMDWWHKTLPGDGSGYATAIEREGGKRRSFTSVRIAGDRPSNTLIATHSGYTHWVERRKLTLREFKRLGSFPDDYEAKTDRIGKYMIGMSVPPKMTEYVAREVAKQWLGHVYA